VFTLPPDLFTLLMPFAPLFSLRVFCHALLLVTGVLLTPGRRTVANALRVLGRQDQPDFQKFHRVLNRAVWSSRAGAAILLGHLLRALVPQGVVLVGIDEHLERRGGSKIAAQGIYRDAARSSKAYLTKASGLRWISLMLLAPIPWAARVWALPFFTCLSPSSRYHEAREQRHKTLTDYARQMLLQLRRWLPNRTLVAVADRSYAALALLAALQQRKRPVTVVTRLRLDAALYDPAPPRVPGRPGRPAVKGKRQSKLEAVLKDPLTAWQTLTVPRWYGSGERQVEVATGTAVWYHSGDPTVPLRWVLVRDPQGKFTPQALLCTDAARLPAEIVGWFVQRWQLEVTFEEARAHLGVETQRQWNDQAIARTTPVLLGLFSLVTLVAHRLAAKAPLFVRQAAWYPKALPTFSDALAAVRRSVWEHFISSTSVRDGTGENPTQVWLACLTETLCYAP
jgi:hypothetical protein